MLKVVCFFFLQMYIHHAIYDLVFKYVGIIEASEVSLFDC